MINISRIINVRNTQNPLTVWISKGRTTSWNLYTTALCQYRM